MEQNKQLGTLNKSRQINIRKIFEVSEFFKVQKMEQEELVSRVKIGLHWFALMSVDWGEQFDKKNLLSDPFFKPRNVILRRISRLNMLKKKRKKM